MLSRPLRLLGLALSLVCALAVAQGTQELDPIRELAREGRYDEALQRLSGYLAQRPEDAQARFMRGVLLAERGDADGAIGEFRRLTRDFPDLPEPYNNLAVLYAARGEFEEARELLQQAINTHPSYATAHENLGDIYAKMAGMAYDQALQLDAENTAAKAKLALVGELFSIAREEPWPAPSVRAAQAAVAAAPAAPVTPAPEPAQAAPRALVRSEADEPVSAPADPGRLREEVLAAVAGWASAWSKQDVGAYLAYYADGFQIPGGGSRGRWESQRRQRLREPGFVEVQLERLQVEFETGERARVRFVQHYRSDSYRDQVRKLLVMTKSGERWRIVREATLQ